MGESDKIRQLLEGTIPPLSREEERVILVRVKGGDSRARETLVRANLRLVVLILKRRYGWPNVTEDLVQEGAIGLLRAAETFEMERGVRFVTYATWWIQAIAGRSKSRVDSVVHRPAGARGNREDLSLDASALDDGESGGPTCLDVLTDGAEACEDVLGQAQSDRAVRARLERIESRLSEVQKVILRHRLLYHDEPWTLATVADQFKMSRERVRQIEAAMLPFLERWLSEHAEEHGYDTQRKKRKIVEQHAKLEDLTG